jgi:hypothetical protein
VQALAVASAGRPVRGFLLQFAVITAAAMIVAAFGFRSPRARRGLAFVRDAIVLYMLAVLALGLFTYFRQEF